MTDDSLPAQPGAVPSYTTDAKPRAGCVFVLLPVVFAAAILAAYIVLFGAGSLGFAAGGDRVRIDIDTCTEAQPIIQARVEMMGLGAPQVRPVDGGMVVEATLPNTPAAGTIPATLVRRGDFSIRQGIDGPVVVDHTEIRSAEFSLKEMGNPLVVVTLNRQAHETLEAHMEAHIDDAISVWIDDEKVFERPNDPPFRRVEVDLRAEGPDGQANMTRAVDWALVMTHGPLPCAATVRSTEPLTGADGS